MRRRPFLFALAAPNYSAARRTVDGVETIRLGDAARGTTVSIVPTIGNMAYEMLVKGHNVLHFPFPSFDAFRRKPRMAGIPLLAPFADRLDEAAFYANGRRYAFDRAIGNMHFDSAGHPIHGFLTLAADWQVTRLEAGAGGAEVTSRLDVSRRPEWMRQFPFPHTIEITYSLRDGGLEVRTRVANKASEPMPMAMGYHSFFQLTDLPRERWRASLAARTEWPFDAELLPTGRTRPLRELVPDPADFALAGRAFDNNFGGLVRDGKGRARFSLRGARQRLDVYFGAKFTTGEIYSPADGAFVCFEPMTAINNGLNLAHRGVYKELQSIAPGGEWRESFWVQPSGF
ncbi:MAG: aldose 1-epimerase [Bryobacterales bacterium]|nr:aldose 1-epimerase [Bryobacterales bacterium]